MNTTRRVLQKSKLVAAAAAALFAVGCGGSSTPPAGSASGSAGTSAGSGSNGSGGSSTSTSGSGGSSGGSSAGSGGSSGSAQPGVVSGTVTFNGQPFTHPGWVGVFDQIPGDGVVPTVLVQTDSAGAYRFTLDGGGGTFYIGAAYAPVDGGITYEDGGVVPPYFVDGGSNDQYVGQGFLDAFPLVSDGRNLSLDGDISELQAAVESLTVNAADLVDGGIPGGTTLPDGGELFPLLLTARLGGADPFQGPMNDASNVTVTPAGAAELGMSYVGADFDWERNVTLFQLNTWKPATDGTYIFSVSGSNIIGTSPYTRQLDVHPLTGIPKIIGPNAGDGPTLGKFTVAWDDTTGATTETIAVYQLPNSAAGSETLRCKIEGLPVSGTQAVPTNTSGCSFTVIPTVQYRIEVIGGRGSQQAHGGVIEAGYNRVLVHG